jgi:hypothetical protein
MHLHVLAISMNLFAARLREFFPDKQMNFPAQMIIVTGTA